jgi:hypothetical protein
MDPTFSEIALALPGVGLILIFDFLWVYKASKNYMANL